MLIVALAPAGCTSDIFPSLKCVLFSDCSRSDVLKSSLNIEYRKHHAIQLSFP
jgi:hypothetical protein